MTEVVTIAGDPDALDSRVRILTSIATSLGTAAKDLSAVANSDVVISLAVDKIRDDVAKSATEARDIYIRYAGTAAALGDYAKELRRIKDAVSGAVARHDDAEADLDYWRSKRLEYQQQAMLPGEDAEHWSRLEHEAKGEADAARSRAGQLASEYEGLLEELELAASAAIQRIDAARSASGLDDRPIDNIEGMVRDFKKWADVYLVPVLEAIRDVCALVAQVLDIVAMVLAFIPIPPMPAIAAALKATAKILGLVALAASVLLLFLQNSSLDEVLRGLVVLAATTLLKFAVGKILKGVISHINVAKIGLNAAQVITGKGTGETIAQNLINYQVAHGVTIVVDASIDVVKGVVKDLIKEVVKVPIEGFADSVVDFAHRNDLGPVGSLDLPSFNIDPPPIGEFISQFEPHVLASGAGGGGGGGGSW